MAKLTIKIVNTGEEFEIEDVDLSKLTPRHLIDEMINQGFLPAETIALYGIVNKNNVKIDDEELCLSFAQLGFVDGDTIRIIMRAFGGGGISISYSNNSISGFFYESTPLVPSIEEKAKQLANEKIAMSRLEQVRNDEDRCRAHIDRIWHGIEEQKHLDTYCMMMRDELPSEEIHISTFRRFDSVDKMQDLLNRRLAQLQNTTSFFERLRGENELKMIRELLMLLSSVEKERIEMMQYVETKFQEKVHEVERRLSYSGIRANKESIYFLESCLSEYEGKLQDLLDRRRRLEKELDRKRKEKNVKWMRYIPPSSPQRR